MVEVVKQFCSGWAHPYIYPKRCIFSIRLLYILDALVIVLLIFLIALLTALWHLIMRSFFERFYLLLAATILVLGFSIRLINLMRMPLFYDGAIHIRNAHYITQGQVFAGLTESKWLQSWVVAQFNPTGPEGVWVARMISALFSTITIAACVSLGRQLGEQRVGLMAGLLYAVLPMAVFHERQALNEPQMAALTTVSTVLVVLLAHKPRLWLSLLLGFVLATAYLTKLFAIPYLTLPVVGVVLLPQWNKQSWKKLGLSALAILVAIGLIRLVSWQAAAAGVQPGERFSASLYNTVLPQLTAPATLARFRADLVMLGDVGTYYFGWVTIGLVVLAGFWALIGEHRSAILFLFIPAVAFGALPLLTSHTTNGGAHPPRYLLSNAAALTVLAALSLRLVLKRLARLKRNVAWEVGLVIVVAILGPALWLDITLIRDPWQVQLTDIDRWSQYNLSFAGDFSNTAGVLLDEWRANEERRIHIVAKGIAVPQLNAYLGPRISDVVNVRTWEEDHDIAAWLGQGDRVYTIEYANEPLVPVVGGMSMIPISTFTEFSVETTLHRVTRLNGPLANEAAEAATPDVGKLDADFTTLAANLLASQILVYPAAHAPTLDACTDTPVIPVKIETWPMTDQAARTALDRIEIGEDGQVVDVILVDEAWSDPQRRLLLALHDRLYRRSDDWFGLLHRISYVTGPADPPLESIDAVFEEAISLEAISILDSEAYPGENVRLVVRWQTAVPVKDSFRVFIHLVDQEERLWTQADSIPGGGLLPMTTWEPGQVVIDRIAIQLPPDLPPGRYQVRIGIYHPVNGLRLRVTQGSLIPDYVIVGEVEVSNRL